MMYHSPPTLLLIHVNDVRLSRWIRHFKMQAMIDGWEMTIYRMILPQVHSFDNHKHCSECRVQIHAFTGCHTHIMYAPCAHIIIYACFKRGFFCSLIPHDNYQKPYIVDISLFSKIMKGSIRAEHFLILSEIAVVCMG